ncbi:MAG: bacteriohemerythrin [Nitrospirae bacterium]|nr:bacteriohemerythrin [Magnetococcales bacterium]
MAAETSPDQGLLTHEDILDFLVRSPSFRHLPSELLIRLIVPILGISHYEPGQLITYEGGRQTNIHLVYRGRVHGIRSTEGGREFHFFIQEGEMFGELALHSNRTNTSTIRAVAPTICLTLELETLKEAMASEWRLARAIFMVIGQRLAERLAPMEITPFPWSESLKVGSSRIDAQHERLFDLINQLGNLLRHTVTDATIPQGIHGILRDLLLYVDTHFHDEEHMMEDLGLPWLEAHKKIHRSLENDIISFNRKIQQATAPESQHFMLLQLHKFLGDLLVNHIMEEDMKVRSYRRPHHATVETGLKKEQAIPNQQSSFVNLP